MINITYFIVIKKIKNLPFKPGNFLRCYKLGNQDVLGGYAIGDKRKKEYVKNGYIKRISKIELSNILIGRNVY